MEVKREIEVHFAVKTPANELVTWIGEQKDENGVILKTWGLYHCVDVSPAHAMFRFFVDTGYVVTTTAFAVMLDTACFLEGIAMLQHNCSGRDRGFVHLVPMHELHALLSSVRPSDKRQQHYLEALPQNDAETFERMPEVPQTNGTGVVIIPFAPS